MATTLLCSLGWAAAPAAEQPQPGVLTLASGEAVRGEFRAGDGPGVVYWQGTHFTQPFAFPIGMLSSIGFPAEQPPAEAEGEFAFELAGGDMLTGRIAGWSDKSVVLESPHFGKVTLKCEALRRLHRLEGNPALVYSGPSGLASWEARGPAWKEDGAHVWTDEAQAMLSADVGLPKRAVIEFELSWKTAPDFALAIGADPASRVDSRRDGWRFESWGAAGENRTTQRAGGAANVVRRARIVRQGDAEVVRIEVVREAAANQVAAGDTVLAVVREQRDLADVAAVKQLSADDKSVHLIAYLDQTAGTMHVFHPDGTPAGEIKVPPPNENDPKTRTGSGVRLVNRHGDVRLQRLQIRKWNGVLPTSGEDGVSRFEFADGNVISGEVAGFDAETQHLLIRPAGAENDAEPESVDAGKLVSTVFSSTPGEPGEDERPVVVFLQDGTQVSGTLSEVGDESLLVASPVIDEPLRLPHSALRAVAFRPQKSDGPSDAEPNPKGRVGRLELGEEHLSGALRSGTQESDASCLVWHPVGSLTRSPLKPGAAGRIVYRDPPKPSPPPTSTPRQPGMAARQPNRNFGAIFLRKAAEPVSRPAANAAGTVHLRSGDAIPCAITAIDEEGVHIDSPVAESEFIPHERIKTVELVGGGSPPDLQEAKKERLLTVPRLQKASPPTHLLCARNGDFLRCRLIDMDDRTIRIELQLSELDVPRDRVAQIIWFHPDEMSDSEEEESEEENGSPMAASPQEQLSPSETITRIQVLQSNGNRVTFQPLEVDGESIAGTSDVLGACRFKLAEIDQLLFGQQIEAAVAELAYHQWRLRAAVEPLVAQDFDESGSLAGTASPLVGEQAPDIDLELLHGGRFRLSSCKGQIVVLDFWASWCGPCMQTMPLLHEAMQEFDPDQVRLVSINLEEPASHIRSVLERHELNLTVALDVDGVAGRRYEADAIPQLVLIDREGTVARLYVGGGREVVEQTKAAIAEILTAK